MSSKLEAYLVGNALIIKTALDTDNRIRTLDFVLISL
jgi:hypothetical protein